MTRDELRAFDPQFAALADMARSIGGDIRVSHYRAHDGWELGRAESDPIGWASIDILKPNCLLEATPARSRK